MNLCIGSSQFGIKGYGISNKNNFLIQNNELKKISNFLLKKNILKIDTAEMYGNALELINTNFDSKFHITNKIYLNNECFYSTKTFLNKFNQLSVRLGKFSTQDLLIHNPEEMLKNDNSKLFKSIEILKDQNKIKKFGLSIYDVDNFKLLLKNKLIDEIQIPFNIIDRRILKHIDFCQSNNIIINIRSIFLQGLLLMDKSDIPHYFNPWRNLFDKWHSWVENKKVGYLKACLAFINNFDFYNDVIIGVNSYDQLSEVCSLSDFKIHDSFPEISSNDSFLINPSNWKK